MDNGRWPTRTRSYLSREWPQAVAGMAHLGDNLASSGPEIISSGSHEQYTRDLSNIAMGGAMAGSESLHLTSWEVVYTKARARARARAAI